jgi:UPF0755 protein
MMRHVGRNTLTLLILLLVLAFGLITWGQAQFRAPGPLAEPLRFEVERGEGLGSVADKLADAGAIGNASLFRIGARYGELDEGLRFGEYELPAGASMREILELLNQGSNVVRQVVVPEGWTSFQVVEALRANEDLTGEIAEVPPEGSLAPAGYDYQRGTRGSRCWRGCGRSRTASWRRPGRARPGPAGGDAGGAADPRLHRGEGDGGAGGARGDRRGSS